MALGYTSQIINSQLVPIAPEQAYNPLTFGQAYTGPAMWAREGVYNVPPILPAASLQATMAPGSYGATGFPFPTSQGPGGNPYHATKSPLWWALGFLAIGILLLQHVHWRK
ncbi:MAG: hypothetical protein ACRD19_05005 [Terriglobia bacterium]